MEKKDYSRLECRIKRRNRMIPCVFLIDASREPAMACIFDPRTRESLDHARIYGPRALKTHAYNFAYIESRDGGPLLEKRPSNRHEAEAFTRAILENAEAISREEYFRELELVIWPPQREWEIPQGGVKRAALSRDPVSAPISAFRTALADEGGMFLTAFSPQEGPSPRFEGPAREGKRGSERKAIIREMVRLMESMELEDLRELLRFSRMLLED